MTAHRPVCKSCEVEYRCSENGVNVVDYGDIGPHVIYEADEFECPSCHHVIIVGFGDRAYSQPGEVHFEQALTWADEHDVRRNNYGDERTKAIYQPTEAK